MPQKGMLVVELSGYIVGRAESWKDAEEIVSKALWMKGRTPPDWNGENTRQADGGTGDFQFSLTNFRGHRG